MDGCLGELLFEFSVVLGDNVVLIFVVSVLGGVGLFLFLVWFIGDFLFMFGLEGKLIMLVLVGICIVVLGCG